MTVFFVSRHPGAVAWARRQGLRVDRWIEHLHAEDVRAGDTVLGTLPVPLVAAVCARGASYQHLRVNLPAAWRGRELSADELAQSGARLERFVVRAEHEALADSGSTL